MKNLGLLCVFLALTATGSAAEKLPRPVSQREFVEKKNALETLTLPLKLPELALRTATWPVKSLIQANEKYFLIERARDFFSNADRTVWLYPALTYSASDGFSFGAVFNHNRFLKSKNYRLHSSFNYNLNSEFDFDLVFSDLRRRRPLRLRTAAVSYSDNRNEKFYGVGEAAKTLKKTIFRRRAAGGRVEIAWHPARENRWQLLLDAGYTETLAEGGHSRKNRPAAEEVFPGILNSGFGEELSFFETQAGFLYDTRRPAGSPYGGGLFKIDLLQALPLANRAFGYRRLQLRTGRLINLSRRNRILALGLHYRAVDGGGKTVPFYELPGLGKNTFLRGYPDNRFRDRQAVCGTVEYRYPIWRTYEPHLNYGLAKLFIDAGETFDRLSDARFSAIKTSYGIGLMLASPAHFLLQSQIAFSRENTEFIVSLNREI